MGMEAFPFLQKVQTVRRWRSSSGVYRLVYFEGRHLYVIRCGMGPLKAAKILDGQEFKPSAIVCAGSAGALVPELKIGDVVVSGRTLFGIEPHDSVCWDGDLVQKMHKICACHSKHSRVSTIVTVNKPVFDTNERRMLHEKTQADAVDMETHAVGLRARSLGIPFLAIRVISDDMYTARPPERQDLRRAIRDPFSFHNSVYLEYKRRWFVRKFKNTVAYLAPILINLVRRLD
jgi:adenosylhomocysteine nucleosidase